MRFDHTSTSTMDVGSGIRVEITDMVTDTYRVLLDLYRYDTGESWGQTSVIVKPDVQLNAQMIPELVGCTRERVVLRFGRYAEVVVSPEQAEELVAALLAALGDVADSYEPDSYEPDGYEPAGDAFLGD